MTVVAYTPKAAYEDPDSLGSVYVNDSTSVNVRERVAEGEDGVFVTEDPHVIEALDRYEPLKRTKVPDSYREEQQRLADARAKAEEEAIAEAKRIQADAEKQQQAEREQAAKDAEKAAAKRAARQGGDK